MPISDEPVEHQDLRRAVRAVCASYDHDYYVEEARTGGKAESLWNDLGEAGFIGVNLPVEHGGGGAGMTELAIVAEEVSAIGCPLLMLIVSPTICGTLIARFGSDHQKERYLPSIASGQSKFAFAITEPDAGSNTHNISTKAVPDGDGWVLTGTKYWCSGADEATHILVVARTGYDEERKRGRLSLFLVDTQAEGFSAHVIPSELVGPEKQFTLHFDRVRLAADDLVGVVDRGLGQLFYGLNPERIMCAATSVGMARYALDRGTLYAQQRSVWGQPIGTHQGISHPLAEAYIHVQLAALMTTHAAALFDAGKEAGEASNIAKFAAADASLLAIDRAIQTHGGNGMSTEFGLADLWPMARLLKVAPVSREMVLNYVAQHSLGLSKSY